MASKETVIDSPAQKAYHPGNASSMPTKNYPSSTKMATAGKDTVVEGPNPQKGPYTKSYSK